MCSTRDLATVLLAMMVASCGRQEPVARDPIGAHSDTSEIWGREFSEKFTHEKVTLLRFEAEQQRIDLTVVREVGPHVAEEMILEKIALFESTFVPARTGYPGQHTRQIEYPEKYRPKRFEKDLGGGHLTWFTGYANANFVHGASSEDLVAFRALYGLLHCPGRRVLVEIDFFAEPGREDTLSRFVADLTCDFE